MASSPPGSDRFTTIGLTVGGFYNHFESKGCAVREVVDTTVSKTVEVDAPAEPEPEHYGHVAARYLTTEHRDNPAGGRPLPCLSADVVRADHEVRTAYARFVMRVVEKMARSMPDGDSRSAEERAGPSRPCASAGCFYRALSLTRNSPSGSSLPAVMWPGRFDFVIARFE